MNSDQQKLLSTFEVRVSELMQYCDTLRQERAVLCEQLAKCEEEVKFLKGRLDTLDTDNEFLKMAKYLSSNQEEKEKARKRISRLVREVDKCIALLNG